MTPILNKNKCRKLTAILKQIFFRCRTNTGFLFEQLFGTKTEKCVSKIQANYMTMIYVIITGSFHRQTLISSAGHFQKLDIFMTIDNKARTWHIYLCC